MLALIVCVAMIQSCAYSPQPYYAQTTPAYYGNQDYQVVQGPNGVQQVVVNNNGTQFLMDYIIFTNLMNSGGYNGVIGAYNRNRSYYPMYTSSMYSRYRAVRTVPRTTFVNNYNTKYGGSSRYSNPSYRSSSGSSLRSSTPRTYSPSSSSSLRSSSPTRSSSSSSLRSSSRSSSSSSRRR